MFALKNWITKAVMNAKTYKELSVILTSYAKEADDLAKHSKKKYDTTAGYYTHKRGVRDLK